MESAKGKLVNVVLWCLLGAGALYVAVHWLLPCLLPFLIAGAAAALLEPGVRYLCRRGLGRSVAAGICVLIFYAALLALLWLLCGRITRELAELLPRLPGMLEEFSGLLQRWQNNLDRWMGRAPDGLALWLEKALAGVTERLERLPGELTGKVFGSLTAFAAAAPSVLLFTVTALIGTYFISAAGPDLYQLFSRMLPARFFRRTELLRQDLRRTLGRWLKAQGLMSLIVCALLTAAFLLLGIHYALVLGLLTAVIDALPVLGAGTVLLPWAAFCFMTGNVPQGTGLVITYAAVTLLRSCIQAKLLGDQLGLHPLATLAAIYAGWKLLGVWGMLLFPILAISFKQALPGLLPGNGNGVFQAEGGIDKR